MRQLCPLLAVALTAVASLSAAASDRIVGEYVEARTAEVFAGGCIMNSEAETAGRQAILAWHITRGVRDGVVLDGLSVVATVAGDRNLGMREMGGEAPDVVKGIVTVDGRATEPQKRALVALARDLSAGLITELVRVDAAPVKFVSDERTITVSGIDGLSLHVEKSMTHDPTCGAMQWFKPFTPLTTSAMGVAQAHAFTGSGLGSRWSAPHKRSAFWGAFAY